MIIYTKWQLWASGPGSRNPTLTAAVGLSWLALVTFLAGCGRSPEAPASVEAAPAQARAQTLADAVAAARPGDTIVLPTGTFEGGITLPPRVSLRGAGYRKTVLDARKAEVGLAIEGGEGAEVADLTVWGASRTDVLVADATAVTLRRLRTTGGLNGVNFADVTGGRIENVISDDNRYGIVISGGRDNAVINCTLARNSSLGLSFPTGDETRAFNNCIADGATGVYLGASVRGARLDHNLYFARFVGRMAGQVGRKTLGDWQSLSGQDAHSVQLPVSFRDPKNGDYRPTGTLPWSLDRAATVDWGVAELSGVKAPEFDLLGAPRAGRHDVGAFEVAPTVPTRPPDGTLSIRSDAGIKSAGVFAPGGRAVAYLFHNLPLPVGPHPFWLPSRDFEGRPIPAGTYEVRTVESALSWDTLHWVGDSGDVSPPGRSAGVKPTFVAFDGKGRLVVGYGRSRDATSLRGFDAASGRWLWAFGGSSDLHGLAVGDGAVFLLKPAGSKGLIARVNPETGTLARRGDADPGTFAIAEGADAVGLAALGGRLYVADARANAIRYGPIDPPALDRTITVPGPTCLAADPSTGKLWAIGREGRIVALDPDGKVVAEATPVAEPAALAARDGRLAVASRATGQVHFFDAHDPNALQPRGTLGTADGPFGPYRPDRFLFRHAGDEPGCDVALALGPDGALAVAEDNRVLVFDRQGQCLWTTFGLAGDACVVSFADRNRVFTLDGRKSIRLDEGAGTWSPDAVWNVPRGEFLGAFADGGQTFGVFVIAPAPRQDGSLLLVRYDGYAARPLLLLARDPANGQYLSRQDTNRDGRIDARDVRIVLAPPRGSPNPLRGGPVARRIDTILQPNGDVVALSLHPETWGVIWHYGGLDHWGTPIYRLEDCRELHRKDGGFISPYTSLPDPSGVLVGALPEPDGGFNGLINFRSAPGGTGLLNHAGTDLIRVNSTGERLWDHSLSEYQGLVGLQGVGPVVLTGVGASCEVLAFNRDGLGLGSFGSGPEAHYLGAFLDHPRSLSAYRGGDGRTYALVADDIGGMQHWYRLNGIDAIVTTSTAFTLAETSARALAALPAPSATAPARPSTPTIRVHRLAAALPIDGDPEKWRLAGITPQVIVTPETGSGAIDGPEDIGAVIRLAYHGNALYLQVLTFDDVPSFHQPAARHHQQDGIEFTINGFLSGFKLDITQSMDSGSIVFRQRFSAKDLDFLIPPDHAPRTIKVLPNAHDVPERRLIEAIYGVDLADSPVIVTECKLPIDATTYKDAAQDLFPLKPGQSFRLGFQIIDNDDPGIDAHSFLVWPATYGHFHPIDDAAIAVFE